MTFEVPILLYVGSKDCNCPWYGENIAIYVLFQLFRWNLPYA